MLLFGIPITQSKKTFLFSLLEFFRISSKEGGEGCGETMCVARQTLTTNCHFYSHSILKGTLTTLFATGSP